METRRILRDDSDYPPALKGQGGAAPAFIDALGNMAILQRKMLGLLCSVKCPGDLVLKTYDTTRALRDAGVTVIGGFHSPMEKECLDLLLRGEQAVVTCRARSIRDMRVPAEWRAPIADGRLLILSPFESNVRRVTKDTARQRNAFMAAIANEVLVPHASPGGEVEALCREILAARKTLYTLESAANAHLMTLGARVFDGDRTTGIPNPYHISIEREN